MISIIFSEDPTLNKRINRIIAVMTIIGFIGAGSLWTWNLLDPQFEKIATEEEAKQFDEEAMNKHKAENSLEEWADKNDVNHIANLLVEAQLSQVNADIAWYEAEAQERPLTTREAKLLGSLLERRDILKKSFVVEKGVLHSHGD